MKKICTILCFLLLVFSGFSSRGQVKQVIDFETGDLSQVFREIEGPNVVLEPSDDFARQGQFSLKTSISTSDRRAEVTNKFERGNIDGENWYGWSFYVPDGFPGDGRFDIISQFHDYYNNQPTWGLDGKAPTHFQLVNGIIKFDLKHQNGFEQVAHTTWDLGAYTQGSWHDIVVNVRWSASSDGFIKIWLNGNLLVNHTGATYMDYPDKVGPYFKMGNYKGSSNWPGTSPRVLYFDEFRMGDAATTYEEVDPASAVPAPVVRMVSPTRGANFLEPADILLEAAPGNFEGNVTSIQFYANETLIGQADSSPFQYTWEDVPAGAYTLTASATTPEDGMISSSSTDITVESSKPVADFQYEFETDDYLTIVLDASASFAKGGKTITEYSWNFGTGDTSTGMAATYSYSSEGTYTVTLEITDSDGESSSISKDVIVTSNANIILDNLDGGFSVLSGNWGSGTSAANKYGANYRFAYSNSTATARVRWTPEIPSPGEYEIYYWLPDGDGNRAANAPFTVVYDGGAQIYEVNQQGTGGEWKLLGTHAFTEGSNGYVELSNNANSQFVIADAIRFLQITNTSTRPKADFSYQLNAQNYLKVEVDGSLSSVAEGRTIEHYEWNFGSGNTRSGQEVEFTFPSDGNYPISLVVTDSEGEQDSISKTVAVRDPESPVETGTIAIESFDYPASSLLNGLNGGNGWNSGWQAEVTSFSKINDGSFIALGVESIGNRAFVRGRNRRTLVSPIDLTDGTIWLGAFIKSNHSTKIARVGFVGLDDKEPLIVRHQTGNVVRLNDVNSNVPSTGDEVFALVRVDFSELGNTAHLWINPDLSVEPSTSTANATKVYPENWGIKGVVIGHNDTQYFASEFDEVRIATNYLGAVSNEGDNIPDPVEEIVIDNTDNGFEVVSGTWRSGTSAANKYGENYRFAYSNANATASARWTPVISASGKYEVYYWLPNGDGNRPTNAPFEVFYNGGSELHLINQRGAGGSWNLLGIYPFEAGTEGYLEIRNNADGQFVIADAVRFIPVEDTAVPGVEINWENVSDGMEFIPCTDQNLNVVASVNEVWDALLLFANGIEMGAFNLTEGTWQFEWNSLSTGSYQLQAVAYLNEDSVGASSVIEVIVLPDEEAPELIIPEDISAVTGPGSCEAVVEKGEALASDNCPGVEISAARSDGLPLTDAFPAGETLVTWQAADAAGNVTELTQTVVVSDHQSPDISLTGYSPVLWPPNHTYHTFTLNQFVNFVTDNCTSLGVEDAYIVKVTSNEAEDASGSGNTSDDIVINDCSSFRVRAERSGGGNGREYKVIFAIQDEHGNETIETGTVLVPKSRGKNQGVPSQEIAYVVNSTCDLITTGRTAFSHSETSDNGFTGNNWRVYPNPVTSGLIYVDFHLASDEEVEITLIDFQGRQLVNRKQYFKKGSQIVEVDAAGIKEGIYLIRIELNDFTYTKKLMIDK